MSLEIKLTNENLITYSRTDDAFEAFQRSAENGQTRLAIEVLAELISGLIDEIDEIKQFIKLDNSDNDQSPTEPESIVESDTSLEIPSTSEEEIKPPKEDGVPTSPIQKQKPKPIKGNNSDVEDVDVLIEQ